MKTTLTQTSQRISGPVLELTSSPAGGPRPARQGQFWPGEESGLCSRRHERASSLADVSFVLPQMAPGNFPK